MPIAAVGGSIIGGILAGNAASNAAQTQANAANTAAQLQYQSGQQALGFQKQVYGQTQAEEAPYLQAGYGGLANLESLLGITPQGNAVQAGGAGTATATPGQTPQQIAKNVAGANSIFGHPGFFRSAFPTLAARADAARAALPGAIN